jgi:tetratricopeptide (TPR) repeat protein
VLLLYVRSSDGQYVAQGSGFLVGRSKIVTNAHVANAGKVFIELGAVRIPTSVEKVDSTNDLAILSVEVEMTAKPLVLASAKPAPGDLIFAITNPEGLERTISQGVVSASREIGTRKLLQVSTPISHGSSGGPIFNRNGEVVGVAVGMLQDGQNLNFAVPAELLRQLMLLGPGKAPDLDSILDQVATVRLQQSEQQFSADPDSNYQKQQMELEALLNRGADAAGNNPEALLKVATAAEGISTEIALSAAKRATEVKPSPDSYLLLANVLAAKYIWLEQGDERRELMKQAEKAARSAVKVAKVPTAEMFYRLGDILEDEGQYTESESALGSVMNMTRNSDSTLYFQAVRDMLLCEDGLNHLAEEKRWFAELQNNGQLTGYDWDDQAKRLYIAEEYKAAGDAYSNAAATIKRDWCDAGFAYDLASETDSSLSANRKCVDALTGTKDSETRLAWAHQSIASNLNGRGVYTEALSHAKEATSLDPTNAWAFAVEADVLNNLHRPTEAITAAREAIRLSDGKYSSMHFALGSAYFESENWELARQSFEKAAQLDPKDDAAAYNVAVCYSRLAYYNDAAHWYEEAIRRNPKRDDIDELRRRIEILRR